MHSCIEHTLKLNGTLALETIFKLKDRTLILSMLLNQTLLNRATTVCEVERFVLPSLPDLYTNMEETLENPKSFKVNCSLCVY